MIIYYVIAKPAILWLNDVMTIVIISVGRRMIS
jgi:hypothetical protein